MPTSQDYKMTWLFAKIPGRCCLCGEEKYGRPIVNYEPEREVAYGRDYWVHLDCPNPADGGKCYLYADIKDCPLHRHHGRYLGFLDDRQKALSSFRTWERNQRFSE